MVDDPRLIYWDSNVVLAYVLAAEPGRLSTLDALIRRTGDNLVEIVTSVVSIAEVAFVELERTSGRLSADVEAVLDQIWDDPAIRLVPLDATLAREARRLIRDSLLTGPRLRPPDAIHLATARRFGIAEFQTYDADLHRWSGRLGFPIREPNAITPPSGEATGDDAGGTSEPRDGPQE